MVLGKCVSGIAVICFEYYYLSLDIRLQFSRFRINDKEYSAFGDLKHDGKCLRRQPNNEVNLVECSGAAAQKWILRKTGMLGAQNGTTCLVVMPMGGLQSVRMQRCQNTMHQKWHRHRGTLIHTQSGGCLDNFNGPTVGVSACRYATYAQLWHFSIEIEQLA